jgi:Zn-finger protein
MKFAPFYKCKGGKGSQGESLEGRKLWEKTNCKLYNSREQGQRILAW